MSLPINDSKLLSDAQKEHAGQLEAAYQLYIQCAKDFVYLAGKSTRPDVRTLAKTAGSRALERADLIKRATKGGVKRVQQEQEHILKRSSRVNGITLPIWSTDPDLSDTLSELSVGVPFM
ncbi:hypothetical protein FRC10_007110 [Ceratobasidium sp. 414]|nr:hypothetical protein FRC10_007110 [Ceratobasidium sp. 414]